MGHLPCQLNYLKQALPVQVQVRQLAPQARRMTRLPALSGLVLAVQPKIRALRAQARGPTVQQSLKALHQARQNLGPQALPGFGSLA